jgi:hypothetical protein
MPFVPKRPLALAHLSSVAASAALAKHFGDVVKAARELGVDRKDLRRLTWHNPRVLKAAHERMWLFRVGVRSKIIRALHSESASRQRWGCDAFCESYEFRDHVAAGAMAFAPAPRQRAVGPDNSRAVLEQKAAAELELERVAEFEDDREPARALWSSSLRDAEAPPSPVDLPVWPGEFPPPPLVVGKFRSWTPPRQEPCRRVARSGAA